MECAQTGSDTPHETSAEPPPAERKAETKVGAWSPLGIAMFRWVWIATVVSNVGTWFQEVAAGWLMTSLSSSPLMVSLVQAATTFPMLLLALPAGAFADIVDRRKLLITMTLWMAAIAAVMAALQLGGLLSAWGLLGLVFAVSIGTAMTAPAWQAIVPELVPRSHLSPAIALNSVGINISRAIGPALAGVVIAMAGPGVAFAVNAVSFFGVVVVLIRWRRQPTVADLPAEHFFSAMASGVRYVGHSPRFLAVLVRSFAFAFFAVALWALL
ncbi:MAG: MFS transporter, partial [Myxococcota bacterium]